MGADCDPLALTTGINTLAAALAQTLNDEELALAAAVLTQLGDTLAPSRSSGSSAGSDRPAGAAPSGRGPPGPHPSAGRFLSEFAGIFSGGQKAPRDAAEIKQKVLRLFARAPESRAGPSAGGPPPRDYHPQNLLPSLCPTLCARNGRREPARPKTADRTAPRAKKRTAPA